MSDYRQCHICDNGVSMDVRKLLSLRVTPVRDISVKDFKRLVSQRKNEGETSLALCYPQCMPQQPKTAGANSKLDKTWGQGQCWKRCSG